MLNPRAPWRSPLRSSTPPILFASAIALALRGTAQARTELNFRQDEFAVRVDVGEMLRSFRSTAWLAGVTVLLALAAFVTGIVVESRRAAALEEQVAQLYIDAFPDDPVPDDPIRALRQQVSQANEMSEFLGVYPGNLSALDLLTELSRLIPKDLKIGLEELSIDRQTVRMRVRGKSFQDADRLGEVLGTFPPFAASRVGVIDNRELNLYLVRAPTRERVV